MLACGLARYSSQLLVFQLEILLSTVDPLLGHATPLYARTPYRYLSLSLRKRLLFSSSAGGVAFPDPFKFTFVLALGVRVVASDYRGSPRGR